MSFNSCEVWFVTGSQHLYGEDTLRRAADHARTIANDLDQDKSITVRIVYKPLVTTGEEVSRLMQDANNSHECVGLIVWMHTFSPAKMWIAGLRRLQKPLLHLHTQFNRDIPWSSIDMNFMNLNQSAHGGRELGHLLSRMRINRKVVVGHWQSKDLRERVAVWSRAAVGWHTMQTMKVARIGDNMREVAVTEGDKVEAQSTFGFAVNGYGVGDLVEHVEKAKKEDIQLLILDYESQYDVVENLKKGGRDHHSLQEAARIELGLRSFLEAGGFGAFTTTFENLHGLKQLPGIAVQRLMADGYGFGAEGDWKTAALVRLMKVMAQDLPGGNSFMEDYTYHFAPGEQQVMGAHMLEVCPSICSKRPRCEIHPLGIGGKSDPVRLVFSADAGSAINVSLVDLGSRFRMVINQVDCISEKEKLVQLPVARAMWRPKPTIETAAASWILAGGGHHTCFSQNITEEYLEDFSEMARVELVKINDSTDIHSIKQELRWNEGCY